VDLLERYLQAVEFWLPRKQNKDIVAELSEDIRSEIEDKEAELERPLVQAELEAILTRWGHPMQVAERYLPQRSLIGPVLLPAYALVLKIVALVYLLPWLLVFVGFVIFDPDRRTAGAIAEGFESFWLLVLHVGAAVTVVFAVLERGQFSYRSWEAWSAGKLLEREPARDPNAIPRSQSIGEVVVGLIAAGWWLHLAGSPTSYRFADTFEIILWPLYTWVYWPILTYLAAGVVLACVNLYRPWWTRHRAWGRLAINSLGLVIAIVVAAGPFVEITAASPRPGAADLAMWANLSWDITALSVGVYCLAGAVQDVRRILGKKPIRNSAMRALGAS
jgi:hypothetical protein